ncbi:MAG: substrate-binding domain-containing protein, partial [Chloroflexi bacterium]|nr:substrate-binding domain-containing protein [Chloroflexota bacterium]
DVCCVRVNNRKGIYLATESLIKKNHKRIAFISEPLKWNKVIDMFEGYCSALNQYGISVDKELIGEVTLGVVSVVTIVENILKIASPPTAILCPSDLSVAVPALRALKEMEINVPQDIALIGYNDDPISTHVEPQLTTVRIPLREMGEESARMLFSLIDGKVPEKREVILEPTLIERQSTKYTLYDEEVKKKGGVTEEPILENMDVRSCEGQIIKDGEAKGLP